MKNLGNSAYDVAIGDAIAEDRKHPIAAYHDVLRMHGMEPAFSRHSETESHQGEGTRANFYGNTETGKGAYVLYHKPTGKIIHGVGPIGNERFHRVGGSPESLHENLSKIPSKRFPGREPGRFNLEVRSTEQLASRHFHRMGLTEGKTRRLHELAHHHFKKASQHFDRGDYSSGEEASNKAFEHHEKLFPGK